MNIIKNSRTSWAEVWENQMDQWLRMRRERGADPDSAAFWNGLHIWETYMRYTNYPGLLLQEVLDGATESQTVLDIGAGTGSFTLPLARQVRWVTAVEPSSAQCNRLMQAAAAEEISNIAVIQKGWRSVSLEETGCHDMVVASYCLFMRDIVAAVHKMDQAARRKVFLVHLAGQDLQDAIRKLRGKKAQPPDHRLLLEVLKEMGLDPTTKVFSRSFSLPLHLQLEMFRSAQGFKDPEVRELEKALETSGRIVERNGEPWVSRTYQDALIAIEKES